jgi:hypothetical protein
MEAPALIIYLSLLGSALRAALSSRQHLVLENPALRQQLAVLSRQSRRPRLACGVPDLPSIPQDVM